LKYWISLPWKRDHISLFRLSFLSCFWMIWKKIWTFLRSGESRDWWRVLRPGYPAIYASFCCRSSHFQNTNLLLTINLNLILYTLLYYIYILLEIVFGGFIYLFILKVSKKKRFRGKNRWNVEGTSSCGHVMMNIFFDCWTMLNSLKYRENYSCKRNCIYAKVL
jgi:hypothetical protein